MISADKGDGINDLVLHFTEILPSGPWMFPKDQVSNLTDRLIAAEITREKIFQQLYKELPYSTTVETEKWEILEDENNKAKMLLQIHDELIFECLKKNENEIKKIIKNAMTSISSSEHHMFSIPLEVSINSGNNWGEAH